MELERNKLLTVFPSVARAPGAAMLNSDDQLNEHCKGLHLTIDMTAVPGVQTVTFTIQGKDPISGKYYTILASAAIVAVSTVVLRVYPSLVAAANLVANDVLPRSWRVTATHSGAGSFTYSVAASLVL